MDFINLPKILRSVTLKESRPSAMTDEDVPMVVYCLSQPIRSRILNYSKFVKSFDLKTFANDENSIPCYCHQFDPKYFDNHHQHILTGDLSIITNSKLRDLISKGPKYREPCKIDFLSARESIELGIETFLESFANKNKVEVTCFDRWKQCLMGCIDSRIEKIRTTFVERKVNTVLDNRTVKFCLKGLHDKFVFVPIDKASSNVAIICKRLYASVISKELDFYNISSPNFKGTYELVSNVTSDGIIFDHKLYQERYSIEVETDMQKLPTMYWSPKIHKTPTGSRFIIASKLASLKPLAKDITLIFKCIFSHIRRYYHMAEFYSGVHQFWVVDNNEDVVRALDKISARGRARSVATFDFSTLYTKIPHDKLIDVLDKLVDFVFNKTDRRFLSVTNKSAHWVKGKRKGLKVYCQKKVKEIVKFLIENCYFTVGGILFRQTIGMPMGSDPAPFFANLFLFFYEHQWIKNNIKSDYARVRHFLNTFRFIDDLIAANDYGEFARTWKEIYPEELALKQENKVDTNATFCDIEANVLENGKFDHKLFDKRDNYNFSIVRFPFKESNIPSKMFHSTIGAEILRICRATSSYKSFIECCNPFIARMLKQGASTFSIIRVINKFIGRHNDTFAKYKVSPSKIVTDLTS